MLTVTLNLSKKTEQQLKKDFKHLESLTERPKDFHIKKAVVRYLEYADKLIKYYEKEKAKGSKEYATEDLLENLNLKKVDWEK